MKRRLTLVVVGVCVMAIVFWAWARGRHEIVPDGTLQFSFEESAFFPNGDCSNKPFWWEYPNPLDADLAAKWEALGNPAALRVTIRGNLSAVGMHGHLGGYLREVQPVALISVNPTSRCQWQK
jgi:hypothetical protein